MPGRKKAAPIYSSIQTPQSVRTVTESEAVEKQPKNNCPVDSASLLGPFRIQVNLGTIPTAHHAMKLSIKTLAMNLENDSATGAATGFPAHLDINCSQSTIGVMNYHHHPSPSARPPLLPVSFSQSYTIAYPAPSQRYTVPC